MATTGILGQASLVANTDTTVYTVPVGLSTTFNVNVVNTGVSPAAVTISISASGTPSAAEYIEYQNVLPPSSVLERGGFVAQAGKNIVVSSSTANVSVSVYGFEA